MLLEDLENLAYLVLPIRSTPVTAIRQSAAGAWRATILDPGAAPYVLLSSHSPLAGLYIHLLTDSQVSGTSRDTGNMVGYDLFHFAYPRALENITNASTQGNGQSTMMQAGTQAQASSGQSSNSLGRVAQSSGYPRSTNQMSSQQPHPKPQRATAPVPRPRPQIADDDICWICREELPARNLPNFQNLRDQHVNNCVARETSRAAGSQGAAGPADPLAQHRNGQLFPYIATEKDCVDDAECTICLEDFEVGVEMGRLECFCRYHKKCIRKWWEKKPGECPVHHAPT